MKIRKKDTGEIGTSHEFNVLTVAPQEIMVYFNDEPDPWMDTDYVRDYEYWIEATQTWKEWSDARKAKDIITDNYNQDFFEPTSPEDRERGYTLH